MLTATATSESATHEEQRLASLELAAPRLPGYEIIQFLGSGTYGDVWKARTIASGVLVAIKRLRREPDAQARDEVEKLAKLATARGIVALRDVHLSNEPYCYVMEYLDGGTLAELIHAKGPLPMKRAWRIFRELIEALSYVHKEGIVHCDIKPENILLDIDGHPRLCDFGQARGRGPQRASLGTRFYMPPEQARVREQTIPDQRWDVYALGAILYEMLTGQKPRFDRALSQLLSTPSGSGSEVRDRLEKYARHLESHPQPKAHRQVKGVDASIAALVDECLALDAEKRPQDASTVRSRIAECDHSRQMRPLMIFGGLAPAIMLLLFGAMVLLIGLWAFVYVSKKWEDANKAYNPITAMDVCSDVKELFETHSSIVKEESEKQSLRSALSPHAKKAVRLDVLKDLFETHQEVIDRWSLADVNGILLANYGKIVSADGTESIGSDDGSNGKYFGWRGWFNGVQDFEENIEEHKPKYESLFESRQTIPFISQPYSRKGDKPFVVVAISIPVVSGGSKVGVLSATLTRNSFFEDLHERAQGHDELGQQIVLVNDHGQVIFHGNDRAWLQAGGRTDFRVPYFPDCQEYSQEAISRYVKNTEKKERLSFRYRDPICGRECLASPSAVVLNTGQRFVVFAQQNDAMDYLKWKLIGVAAILLSFGGVFLGVNSYALYWMQRQQRENVVDV